MKKNLKKLKKALLKKIRPGDEKFWNSLSLYEAISLFGFYMNPSDDAYNHYVFQKLKTQRDNLTSRNIPIDQWPESLRGSNIDWEKRMTEKLGIKLTPSSPVEKKDVNDTKSKSSKADVQKMRQESKPVSIDGSTRDFYEWAFNWREEKEEGIIPLVNRVKR